MPRYRCTACGDVAQETFFEAAAVPTNSCLLMDSAEEARAHPRGDIRLACCRSCGFIANVAFDPVLTEYSERYEETQSFSPRFNAFHEALARSLVEDLGIRNADVVEIGCGKGEFLLLLAELGGNRCLGFDPGFAEDRLPTPECGSLRVERSFFTEGQGHLAADLVVCKMTLEHIAEPRPLLAAVREVATHRPGALVFFQVPDVARILAECAFEDIYYEHCAYYGPGPLARLFHSAGFGIHQLESVYGGQYLTLVASPDRGPADDPHGSAASLAAHLRAVDTFTTRVAEARDRWQERLDGWAAAGRRVVLWGSGSKAVSFLTTLDAPAVEHVVDINPHRQGHFMAGTGQPIVGPDDLTALRPDVVVILNRVYRDEIRGDLRDRGLDPQLAVL